MSAQPKLKYTLEEYLEMDRTAEARLEYWKGEIFDMSGVSPEHDEIEGNVYHQLRLKLKNRKCRVFLANIRIKVPSLPPYRYGDLSALCGQPQYETIGGVEVLTNPALIIEVLSHSTETYDRVDKFTHYKSIPSFSEYLLVEQVRPHVTQFLKIGDGSWIHREYNDLEAVVNIDALECELKLSEIYENVAFDESARLAHLRFQK
jgi:Uma2 family endonuclease